MAGYLDWSLERERTYTSLFGFELIANGSKESYSKFIEAQEKNNIKNKLSYHNFQSLHGKYNELKQGLQSQSDVDSVINALIVLGDMGKSSEARERVKEALTTKKEGPVDADEYKKYLAMSGKALSAFSVYQNLTNTQKELVKSTILNEIHFGHASHAENGKNAYELLEKKRDESLREKNVEGSEVSLETLLKLAEFVHICDVAGARGHNDNRGSLLYTNDVHQKLDRLFGTCLSLLKDKNMSARDVYYDTLSKTCENLGLQPINNDSLITEKVTAFLVCQRRISTKEDAESLLEEVHNWPEGLKNKIWDNFGVDGKIHCTYLPALLCTKGVKTPSNVLQVISIAIDLAEKYKENFPENIKNRPPLNFNAIIPTMENIIGKDPENLSEINNLFQINEEGEAVPVSQEIPKNYILV